MSYEIAFQGRQLDRPRVQAYMYAGHWVVNCADIVCTAVNLAEEPGPAQRFRIDCPDCGASADIEWPDPDTFEAINAVMRMRPVKLTRNWAPAFHRQAILSEGGKWCLGQSVEDLLRENFEHGLRV